MSREALKELLNQNIPDYSNKELWVFCAGITAVLYKNGLDRLEKENIFIAGYIDNNKAGEVFNDKNVVKLDSLKDKKNNILVLICTYYSNVIESVSKQLDNEGFTYCTIDDFILKAHAEQVLNVYDEFNDEQSRDIYEQLIRRRISGKEVELPFCFEEQYFGLPNFISNSPKEVFVDCGAYVGDTLEKYIWKNEGVFGKIISFEPDLHNVKAMNYRIDRLCNEWGFDKEKICVYANGLSDSCMKASVDRSEVNNGFSTNITLDSQENGNDIVSLDSFLKENISFLKADIESWEYYMLKGARESIKKYKPKLAICIYHNAVDFYEIPLFIKEILPDYKVSIRHHSHTLCETVLYAWI